MAFLAAFGFSRWKNPLAGASGSARLAALLTLGATACALVAALSSPRRHLSLDATRALLLMLLLLPLGASRAVERRKTLLLWTFLAVAAINAAVSTLQARGIYQPFPLVTEGRRDATGAFVGNVGYLALGLSLAAVAALSAALLARRPAAKAACFAAAALFAGALLINRNLTALTVLAAGWSILAVCLFRRRAILGIGGMLLLLAAGIAFYRPLNQRAREAIGSIRRGDWDALVTYRLGPWATAVQMAAERPLTGWGPGTFGAEYVAHRLELEIATRKRFVNPLLTSSYGEAHNDYLQPFAEAGVPAGLALVAAVALLLRGLGSQVRRLEEPSRRVEAVFLFAFLVAGATAALTWFPLQRPITAVPLLLAAGRAWKISRERPGAGAEEAP